MKTLLIVDDSASIRNIVKVFLTGSPFEVIEAESGERALQLLKLLDVAVVIADLNMPGMDGLALTREIRRSPSPKLRQLPVLLLTGETARSSAEGMASGASAFLRKPISGHELLRAVEATLAQVH